MPSRAKTRVLQEPEEIRRWAEDRGAKPAAVRRTGGDDVGIIRLDFPGYSGGASLEPISWEDFFAKFEESGLALLVQDETAGGQRSNFNKLVSRASAAKSGSSSRHRGTRRIATKAAGSQKRKSTSRSSSRSASTRSAGTRSKRSAGKGRSSSSAKRTQASKSSSSRSRAGSTRKSSATAGKKKQVRNSGRGRGNQSSRKAA